MTAKVRVLVGRSGRGSLPTGRGSLRPTRWLSAPFPCPVCGGPLLVGRTGVLVCPQASTRRHRIVAARRRRERFVRAAIPWVLVIWAVVVLGLIGGWLRDGPW